MTLWSTEPLIAKIKERNQTRLRTLETGAELSLPAQAGVKQLSDTLILVWSTEKKPTFATLYESKEWKPLAKWPSSVLEASKKTIIKPRKKDSLVP